jgi:hypothetical protein
MSARHVRRGASCCRIGHRGQRFPELSALLRKSAIRLPKRHQAIDFAGHARNFERGQFAQNQVAVIDYWSKLSITR